MVMFIKEEDLRRMYEDERMTQFEIGRWYGESGSTIHKRMKDFGIESRVPRIYDVNEDFFKTWIKESAWVFGWFVGDGYITGGQFGFTLARKDKGVLCKFKKVMESEHPVHDYISPLGKLSMLRIGSMEMVKNLRSLRYKDVPDWHRSDLIRGFFEAEGWVGLSVDRRRMKCENTRCTFVQKDNLILERLWSVLREENIVKGGGMSQVKRSGAWHLYFGESDSVSLYHYMYDDCGELYLERKKSRFEELMAYRGFI